MRIVGGNSKAERGGEKAWGGTEEGSMAWLSKLLNIRNNGYLSLSQSQGNETREYGAIYWIFPVSHYAKQEITQCNLFRLCATLNRTPLL